MFGIYNKTPETGAATIDPVATIYNVQGKRLSGTLVATITEANIQRHPQPAIQASLWLRRPDGKTLSLASNTARKDGPVSSTVTLRPGDHCTPRQIAELKVSAYSAVGFLRSAYFSRRLDLTAEQSNQVMPVFAEMVSTVEDLLRRPTRPEHLPARFKTWNHMAEAAIGPNERRIFDLLSSTQRTRLVQAALRDRSVRGKELADSLLLCRILRVELQMTDKQAAHIRHGAPEVLAATRKQLEALPILERPPLPLDAPNDRAAQRQRRKERLQIKQAAIDQICDTLDDWQRVRLSQLVPMELWNIEAADPERN